MAGISVIFLYDLGFRQRPFGRAPVDRLRMDKFAAVFGRIDDRARINTGEIRIYTKPIYALCLQYFFAELNSLKTNVFFAGARL